MSAGAIRAVFFDAVGTLIHPEPAAATVYARIGQRFGTRLGVGDLTGAYAGVRPLISTGDSKKSVDISRKAELYETSSGMITITGGKLTTWRRMAKLAVDRLVARDGRQAPCRTQEIPLGARPDEAHVPAEDVPELRELVEPGPAQQLPGPRDAGVALAGEQVP